MKRIARLFAALRNLTGPAVLGVMVVIMVAGATTATAARAPGEKGGLSSSDELTKKKEAQADTTKGGWTPKVEFTIHSCGETPEAVCDPKNDPDRIRKILWESKGPQPGKVPLGKITQTDRLPKEEAAGRQRASEPMVTGLDEPMPTEVNLANKATEGCPEGQLCAQKLVYGHVGRYFHWWDLNIDWCVAWYHNACYGITFEVDFRHDLYGGVTVMYHNHWPRYESGGMVDKGAVLGLPFHHYMWQSPNPRSGFYMEKRHRYQACPWYLPRCGEYFFPRAKFWLYGNGEGKAEWWSH